MDHAAIDVSGLVKTFGSFRALDGLAALTAVGMVAFRRRDLAP
jgi:hypothetical protein